MNYDNAQMMLLMNCSNHFFKGKVGLNYKEIESHPIRVSNIKPLINKYNWNGIKCPSKIDGSGKHLRKIIQQFLLRFYTLKK